MSGKQSVGRIAFREEGNLWAAYFAQDDTMEGAVFLGSIRLRPVEADPELKGSFMDAMKRVVNFAFSEELGVVPEWGGPRDAPEHERGGRA